MRLLITGATGFVGTVLLRHARSCGHVVYATTRHRPPDSDGIQWLQVSDLSSELPELPPNHGIDTIIHLAGRAHVMDETADDPFAVYQAANVGSMVTMIRLAHLQSIKRVVFLSSIKAMGNRTEQPFTEGDQPCPDDPYGETKLAAEQLLREEAATAGYEWVVVRAPLVYGPGVGANLYKLIEWVKKGWPLPLASIRNQRSFIGVDNLADALLLCAAHPLAADHCWLVSDGEDLSTPELIRRIAIAMERPARLFRLPPVVFLGCLRLMGRTEMALRLCTSLQVSSSAIRERLGWTPPRLLNEGIEQMLSCHKHN